MNEFFTKILNASHDFKEDERLLQYKFQTLMALIIFASCVVFIMAFVRIEQGNYAQAFADIVFLFVMGVGTFLLYRDKHFYNAVARSILLVGFSVAIWLLHTVAQSQSRIIWFSLLIALLFFILNKREGFIWLAGVITVLCILFFDGDFLHLSGLDFGIFLINLVMLAMVLLWYEIIKADNEKYLHNYAQILEKHIQERTSELKSLNKELSSRVEAGIKEIQEKDKVLLQQSKLASMGEMIGNIAHQWRQPLNALSLTIQNIEDAFEYGELDEKYIAKASAKSMTQINYMSKTIDDFRDFVKPNQTITEINLYQTVNEALSLVSSSLEKDGISYVIKKPSSELRTLGYVSEFKQVIVNLLNNAKDEIIENELKDGKIEITFSQDKENIKIMVQDNAGGIPKEIFNRIFEPYFTTKEEGKGTGIGLYMAHVIITEKMHGNLVAENLASGALFTITLPSINDQETAINRGTLQ